MRGRNGRDVAQRAARDDANPEHVLGRHADLLPSPERLALLRLFTHSATATRSSRLFVGEDALSITSLTQSLVSETI
jgi:hypothetical protein